jgi:putative peptide zinc metalloprotease protein
MYFESWVAAGAALVWAFTETSVVHSVAYQAMILASVTTLAFNVNPLMRFDGYFILSDLLQVPNLRDQSRAIVVRWAKRFAIGIDPGGPPWSVAMGLTLAIYAIASAVYRVVVVVGMCAVIAVKFFAVGMALALAYAATTLVGAVFKATRYLLTDDETRPVRIRAAVVAAALLIVPALAVSLPFPRTLPTTAVAARERERIVTAGASGFVDSIAARGVATIRAGEPLVRLASLELEEAASTAEAGLAAATAAFEVASAGTPAERAVAGHEQGVAEVRAATARDAAERLVVRAPIDGAVVELLGATDRGRFIPAGTPVATIAQGAWMAEALLDQIDLAALRRSEQVELRGLSDPSLVLTGRIASIAPAGKREIEVSQRSLTVSGGGDIPVSPLDGHAADVRFLVRIAIDDDARAGLVRGERLAVRLPARPASLVQGWYRGVLRFRERLAAAE